MKQISNKDPIVLKLEKLINNGTITILSGKNIVHKMNGSITERYVCLYSSAFYELEFSPTTKEILIIQRIEGNDPLFIGNDCLLSISIIQELKRIINEYKTGEHNPISRVYYDQNQGDIKLLESVLNLIK